MRTQLTVLVAMVCACSSGTLATAAPRPAAASLRSLSGALQEISHRVGPAVVKIEIVGAFQVNQGAKASDQARRQRATGSGVILDADGYIVTNHHVVAGASRVNVILGVRDAKARSILKRRVIKSAEVVGTDRETDLAVLKIDGNGYPHLALTNSDQVKQGQLVLAFGSPHGLRNSVTMGVVSAQARQLQPEHPVVFIQSDVAVNPGNSGGPLVDIRGRVIGINSVILSRSGGSHGLSFAIPSNIVRHVYKQIRTHGRVRRGFVGVNGQTIDQAIAQGLGLSKKWGVILSDVMPDGPAALAGLEVGDIVQRLDGKPMENGRQMAVNVYQKPIGDNVTLEILRDGKIQNVRVEVAERPDSVERLIESVHRSAKPVPQLAIFAVDLSAYGNLDRLPLRIRSGVVVVGVTSQSSAAAGLAPGDIIHRVNRKQVDSLASLITAMRGLKGPAVLQIERDRILHLLTFDL